MDAALKKRDGAYSMMIEKLFKHVKDNKYLEVEHSLNRFMVPMETKDDLGNTLLNLAAQCRSKKIVQLMLGRGANVSTQNLKGNTPLHSARAFKDHDVCSLLI